jgi:hypothetical protein
VSGVSNVLAVDPGVTTGWAFWRRPADGYWRPTHTGLFRSTNTRLPTETRLRKLFNYFDEIHDAYDPYVTVIESTEDQGPLRGSRGALHLLGWIVGGYAARSRDFLLIRPREWKGNMEATAVELRVRRATGQTYREHEREAVGLGLGWMGAL